MMKSVMHYLMILKKNLKKTSRIDRITALFFILILIGSLFFFLRKKEDIFITLSVVQNPELTYTGYGNPPEWFVANLKPGLEEKDLLGRKKIQIVNVYKYEAEGANINPDVYITLKIEAVYDKKNGRYSYDGVPLLVGGFQKFSIHDLEIKGIVQMIGKTFIPFSTEQYRAQGFLDPENNDFPKKKQVQVFEMIKKTGIPKTVSSKINPGITVKDTNGNIMFKILNVTKKPAAYVIPENGTLSYIYDPEREHVELDVLISAVMINGKPFFKRDFPLTVNTDIELVLPDVRVVFTIKDLQKAE